MAGPTYEYIGDHVLTYPDYRDTVADRMLIAEPGGSYVIAAAGEGPPDAYGNRHPLPVPPTDGRWLDVAPPPPPPPAPPRVVSTSLPKPAVPVVPPATTTPEDGA